MGTLTSADIVVAIVALAAALVTGALGYGFSSITVPVALLFFPAKTLAPSLVLVELFVNMLGLFLHRDLLPTVWRRMAPMLVGLLPGVGIGAWVLSSASAGKLKLATYVILVPFVIAQAAGQRWPIQRERTAAVPMGAAIGALYSATTISGPPLALFLNNQGLAQLEFRAAVYIIRVAESLSTTIVYLSLGLFSQPSLTLAGSLVPSLVVGLPIGMVLLRRIEPEAFRRICMGVNAAFIAFGLARSLIDEQLAPAAVAYGVMLVIGATVSFYLARFFVRRREALRDIATAPRT